MDVSDHRVYHHFMVIFKVWNMLLQSPLVSEVDQGTKKLLELRSNLASVASALRRKAIQQVNAEYLSNSYPGYG